MGKTTRRASIWMEFRFKYGDSMYPEKNETHYFNGRYQNKMRNGNRSYYALFIDPESIKVRCWREYGNWAKAVAHRAARHNAKILTTKLAHVIMDEVWQEEQARMWEDDDWYDDHLMSFDSSYSDEAYEYAEQRRREAEEEAWNQIYGTNYDYDPYYGIDDFDY